MWVTNINGTSEPACGCGSWLEHWKMYSGQERMLCPVEGCFNKIAVGVHVKLHLSLDERWYIMPMCQEHNMQIGKSAEIDDELMLIPSTTCDTRGRVGQRDGVR